MRRRLLVVLSVVIAAGALVVGASAATAGASTASKITKCAPKSAAKGITKAMNAFLQGETTDDKVKLIDLSNADEAAFKAALEASSAGAEASGSSLPVKAGNLKATCSGKKAASFTYDLEHAETGAALLPAQPGDAVLKGGKWRIDPVLVCDLTNMNPGAPPEAKSGCYTSVGLEGVTE
jgi:hypothetical protein